MSHLIQIGNHFHLYQSIITGDKVTALFLIYNNVDINAYVNGNNPLHWAIYSYADLDIITLLLDKGVNIHATNHQNYTPLLIAVDHNRMEAALLLIQRGALVGENLSLLLFKATVKNNPTLIKMLIDYGMQYKPSIDLQYYLSVIFPEGCPEIIDKYIPEILVTRSGYQYRESIKTLLKWNFTINPSSYHNEHFIYSAVEKGYSPIVSQLLELGINVNMVNSHTRLNLLTVACLHRYDEIVENLLKHHADVNAKIPHETWILINQSYFNNGIYDVNVLFPSNHSWNMTCLHIAVFNSDPVITKLLLRYGAEISEDPKFINITSFAAQNNYGEIVRMFLEHAWSRDYGISVDGDSLLHKMIENKFDPECIKMLLKLNFPVNILNRNGLTPLLLACKTYSTNQLKIIEVLLQYNADANSTDNELITPLHVVCSSDFVYKLNTGKIIQLLLKHNANIEAVNRRSWTPLLQACYHGNDEAVKVLLENHANPHASDNRGQTALHLSCEWKHETTLSIIQLLLKHNANIEAVNIRGWTPLFDACESGNIVAVKFLLENHANPNAIAFDPYTDQYGKTALHFIHEWEPKTNLQIIQLLLKHNANIGAVDENGETPLLKACNYKDDKVIKCLLENHANPNATDKLGQTALHLSCIWKHTTTLSIIQLLLKHNANIEAVNIMGSTPLFNACEFGNIVAVKCLLENHANPNATNQRGITVLHLIHSREDEILCQIIQLLLKHNANIEAVDEKGWTPLFTACISGNDKVVRALLRYGANVNILDKRNQTPLQYAVENMLSTSPVNSNIYTIIKMLVSQIIKLKTARLNINACEFITINGVEYSAIEGLKSNAVLDDTIDTLNIMCEEEIERMKMESIGINNMFFYDLLTQHIHLLGILMENKKIQGILKPSIYDEKFPLYIGIIRCRLRHAQFRYRQYKLKKSAGEYFSLNINQQLPHECIDEVLNYLTIVDLKTFIGTFELSKRVEGQLQLNI